MKRGKTVSHNFSTFSAKYFARQFGHDWEGLQEFPKSDPEPPKQAGKSVWLMARS